MSFKGSNRCILEFISSPTFVGDTNALIQHTGASISKSDTWFPEGLHNPDEAELKDFLKGPFTTQLGKDILQWWLQVCSPQSKTPNWDLVSTCNVNGTKGILLVEAKAHHHELNGESIGKRKPNPNSENSKANHQQIGNAIAQANTEINKAGFAVSISRDKCYQLSNRVAHAWWLANQGIPVVLLYLGFLNAEDMRSQWQVFNTHQEWENCFMNHAKKVGVDAIIGKQVNCGKSYFTTVVKSF